MIPIVDIERARIVVLRAHEAFRTRSGLLSETNDLVENQIPNGVEPLSRDHTLFLFYSVVNDHGMKSSRLYARAKALFLENRNLFEPFRVIEDFNGPEDGRLIELTGRRLGTRYPKETAKTWYLNSRRLVERFNGDPRNLFRCAPDARTLMKEITAFRGYGPKIGGMLLRAVIGLGFADVTGVEEVLVPVDIHDSRISFFTGILRLGNHNNANVDYYAYVPQVQRILLETCNSLGLKWLDTDHALWLIGSRGCVNKRCRPCPLHDVCTVGNIIVADKIRKESAA
jgi:endonuclease III